jgi:hypothetical protein
MRLMTLLIAGLFTSTAQATEPIAWDNDPMASMRTLLKEGRKKINADSPTLQAAKLPEREPERVPTIDPRPFTASRIPGRLAPVAAPTSRRSWRRIRGKIPIGPTCLDGQDPPCLRETPLPTGSPPQGGYYYGYWRDKEGKLIYGKLYLPHYGSFNGAAHNNPPQILSGLQQGVGTGVPIRLQKKVTLKNTREVR